MAERNGSHLNRVLDDLPEGLVVDAGWLEDRGIASNLRAYYVKSGWLVQPTRGVYRRPRGLLSWEQVVISMQLLLDLPFVVGGRTALELHGYAHYLARRIRVVHLYGRVRRPGWLGRLDLPQHFAFHHSKVWTPPEEPSCVSQASVRDLRVYGESARKLVSGTGIAVMPWGQWKWPLAVSQPELAFLELLDELPRNESFHQADMVMQGAANFSPERLRRLLAVCNSVKVKRLFFFFADRHQHVWRKHLDAKAFDLGKGKRLLVRGGRLDPVYQITVPKDLDGLA